MMGINLDTTDKNNEIGLEKSAQSGYKTIILAAGKGTRMKSDTPKVLHKIFDKPLLGYVMEACSPQAGCTSELKPSQQSQAAQTFVIVGHQAEEVEKFVAQFEGAKTVLQSPQLGTGDAVSKVCPYLKGYDGEVLILCGDTPLVTSETLEKFVKFHHETNSDLTVMSAIFENPTNYGRIVRKDNRVDKIVEEKDADSDIKEIKEINAGIYCLNWSKIEPAFSQLTSNNAQGEYYLTDIIKWSNTQGHQVNAYVLENNEEIFGINSREHLSQATKMLNNRTLKKLMDSGVTVVDPETTWVSTESEIGADTTIYPFSYINGKNKIGTHCTIGPSAHIRGGVEIGDYVKIGNYVEVKNSTISSNTNACHLSYVGDSDIGSRVNIGAGTITANYNSITKDKNRTTVNDDAKIGSNSVLVAPVEVGEGANIGAGSVITKSVAPWSLALTRAPLRVLDGWVKKMIGK